MKLITPLINIKVISTATCLPDSAPLNNEDILAIHSSTKFLPAMVRRKLASSIVKRYGIHKRYMVRIPGTSPEKLTDETSGEDLARTTVEKCYQGHFEDIDLFIHGTTTSSRYTGSQATAVLSNINQTSAAIEMKAGCSTSLASMYMGIMGLMAGHENVMINCVETMSKVVNPKVRETWFGLGDGASALWMKKVPDNKGDFKILGMTFGTNGSHVDMYTTQGKLPPNRYDLENGGYHLAGDGSKLEELAFEHYQKMFELFSSQFDMGKIKYLIPHQVNDNLIYKVVKRVFKAPEMVILKSNDRIGNIGGSSVLFTLCEQLEKKPFERGDQILLMSVGGGLSFCMQLWEKL